LPLPGPSTRSSGSITTTERSRGSRPSSPPPAGAATSHFSPHSHAWLSRQRRATLTPGWPLAGQRSTAAAACARARPGQIRNRRSPARLRTTSAGSPPSRPTRAVDRAARTPQTTCNSIRSSREGCPPHRRDPQGHPWASASETEVTGRTGGHQPAGHRTGGHQPAGHRTGGHQSAGHQSAGWTPDGWTPDGWTTGPRTSEPGWTPNGGHGPATDSMAGPGIPDRCSDTLPLGRRPQARPLRCRLVDQQPGQLNRKDTAQAGLATAATRQRQGDTPPSSRRLGALLSCVGLGWYEGRAMGLRKGGVCGVGLATEC
jgi:hypothetical protein